MLSPKESSKVTHWAHWFSAFAFQISDPIALQDILMITQGDTVLFLGKEITKLQARAATVSQ